MTPEEIEIEELRLELKRLDRQSAILNLLFIAAVVLNSFAMYGICHHWSDFITASCLFASLLIAWLIVGTSRPKKEGKFTLLFRHNNPL